MTDDYREWIIEARRYYAAAKCIFAQGFHDVAFFNTMHSAELALKSLLINIGESEVSLHSHNEFKLFNRIEESKKYPDSFVDDIRKLILPLPDNSHHNIPYIDMAYNDGPISMDFDCESGESVNTKYPKDSVGPYKYIRPENTKEKLDLCERLIIIIEKYFNLSMPEHP